MPSKSKIMALPDDVRRQLDERLRDSLFRDFESHETWLASLGYSISKALIQRYSGAHRVRIRNLPHAKAQSVAAAGPTTAADRRLECLRLAAAHKPASPQDQMRIAEGLYAWLHMGGAKPAI